VTNFFWFIADASYALSLVDSIGFTHWFCLQYVIGYCVLFLWHKMAFMCWRAVKKLLMSLFSLNGSILNYVDWGLRSFRYSAVQVWPDNICWSTCSLSPGCQLKKKQEVWADAHETRESLWQFLFASNLGLSPSTSSRFTLLQLKIAQNH